MARVPLEATPASDRERGPRPESTASAPARSATRTARTTAGSERDPADRRAVLVRALRDRNAEVFRLYAGMNASLDRLLADYTDQELDLLVEFLRDTTSAGRAATDALAGD